jgi:hypothetical protein
MFIRRSKAFVEFLNGNNQRFITEINTRHISSDKLEEIEKIIHARISIKKRIAMLKNFKQPIVLNESDIIERYIRGTGKGNKRLFSSCRRVKSEYAVQLCSFDTHADRNRSTMSPTKRRGFKS